MAKRKSIPETVKLQLWVKSAGRCEFKGCNRPVWHNDLTLSDGNFAEVAHIIGSSKSGPRGTAQSNQLQTDFANLMLLCQQCHKEIDGNPGQYPAELLRQWKREHEERIEIQTSHPEEIHRSTVLFMSVNIGDRITPINMEAARNAMFPKFPTNKQGIKIEESDFNRLGDEGHWQSFAEHKIKRRIKRCLEEGIDDHKIKHLSVFGIAPMPLLMYLGYCIGDTIPVDIYQSHRNIADTSKTWSWQEDAHKDVDQVYRVSTEKSVVGSKVLLLLELSDTIAEDKYQNMLPGVAGIYRISSPESSPHFLSNRRKLELFSYEYRKLLNVIQTNHGRNCEVYLLPALPVSAAVECGRVILPTKDPVIYVCEYFATENGFRKVLRIN